MDVDVVKVSIVIPAYNEAENVPSLIDSLMELRTDQKFEIIVVDNGSMDATSEIARAQGINVVRIERASVAAARNAGVRRANGNLLVFLDADVIVTNEWRESVLELVGHDRLMVITGDVYDIVEKPSWIERHWFYAHYLRGAHRYINGGNLIISREKFLETGGFDESMTAGEDVEFCKRAAAHGVQICAERRFRVLHKGYPSTVSDFIRREAWHGRSDFLSLRRVLESPVALLTCVFVLLHLMLLTAVVFQAWPVAALASCALVLFCTACAVWKWRHMSAISQLVNAIVFYFYFVGRSIAAWRDMSGPPGR